MGFFFSSLKGNSKVNIPIWPKVELVRDLMHLLIIYKFHKVTTKDKWAILAVNDKRL